MDLFGTILALLGVGFLLKGVIGGIRAGMREAQRRLDADALGDQVTEPARDLDEDRRSYPSQSTVFGLIGAGALVILLVRSCGSSGSGPEVARTPDAAATGTAAAVGGGAVPPPPTVPAATDPEAQARQQADFERRTVESAEQLQYAAAKSKQAQTLALARDALAAIEKLKVEMALWENTVLSLRSSDKGRALAGQPQLVRRYRALVALPRPDGVAAEDLASETQTVQRPIEVAYATPGDIVQPSPEVVAQLTDILKRVREALEAYQKPRLQIEALVSHAQGTGEPPSNELLGAVIARQEREEALESSKVIEQEYIKAKEDAARRLAAAKADLVRAEAEKEEATLKAAANAAAEGKEREVERIRTLAELQKKTETEKLDVDRRTAELERQRLFVRSAHGRQQILSYLRPFITPGYSQPPSRNWRTSKKQGEKKPVSLSVLRESGALDESLQGLFTLAVAANNDGNDRPHWTLEILSQPEQLSNQAIEFLKVPQALLREYGDAMVEENLLSK